MDKQEQPYQCYGIEASICACWGGGEPMDTVLVVDDAPSVREFLKDVLSEWNFSQVLLAGNVATARELLRRYSVDFALVDCVLPTVSGFWLASYLKSEG